MSGRNRTEWKINASQIRNNNIDISFQIWYQRYYGPNGDLDWRVLEIKNKKIQSYEYYNSIFHKKGLTLAGTGSGTTPTGTYLYIYSDDRIKHNEVNIENGLSVIRQLQPQKYQKTTEMYPADYVGEISGDWIWECGVIAQEILKIADISFGVGGGDEIGPSGETIEKKYYLNYNNIFTYGLAAIKELDQIVSAQETTIANLEQENIDLSNNVNLLQQENATMKAALNELLTAAGKPTI